MHTMVDLAKNFQRAGKNLISMWSPRVVGLGIPGEFDCISFPHDMKIGLASDWLRLTHLQCQTPLGMPSPPYIYWCINEITRGAPCKVEKLTKMANLAWMANLAKILYGFGEYSIWMQNMAPSRLAIMTKMANGEDSENWTAMANPVKKHQRVERAILAKMAYLAKMANMANTHQSLQMKWQRSLLKERGDFDKKKWKWLIWRKFVKALTTCEIGWHRGPLKSGDFGENGKNGERGENFPNSPN